MLLPINIDIPLYALRHCTHAMAYVVQMLSMCLTREILFNTDYLQKSKI